MGQEIVVELEKEKAKKKRKWSDLALEDAGMEKFEVERGLETLQSARVRTYEDEKGQKRLVSMSTDLKILDEIDKTLKEPFIHEKKVLRVPEDEPTLLKILDSLIIEIRRSLVDVWGTHLTDEQKQQRRDENGKSETTQT